MKKFIAAAAVALAFAMAVPAFAATPEEYNSNPGLIVDEVTVESSTHAVTKLDTTAANQKAQAAVTDANINAQLTERGLDVNTMKIIGAYEVDGTPGTVVFAIPDVQVGANQKLVALHEGANGWEVIDLTQRADGQWEGVFGDFSPVLFALVDVVATAPTDPTTPTDPTEPTPDTPADVTEPTPSTPAVYTKDLTKSPKTGEGNAVAVIAAAAATVA